MEKSIGIGLIGCGIWGEVHTRTYASSPLARFVAVCDLEKDRAEQFAQKYSAELSYTDFNDLLANPDIEAVAIATPDFSHANIVLAAIEAGKHVLVEKPMATTIGECEQIIAARDANGVKLMVDFHNRWNIPFIHVRRMVESDELGDLLMMNIRLNDTIFVPTKLISWAAKSSPLYFLGSHVVDLVRWLSGAEVKRVFSVCRSVVLRKLGIDTPDFYQTILELSNGGTAFIENCWIVAENAPNIFEFKAEFIGVSGSTYVDVSHHRMIEKYTQQGSGLPDVAGAFDLYGKPVGFCTAAIEHFIDCVVYDTMPLVCGEDGLKVTQVLEAVERSAQTGQSVNL